MRHLLVILGFSLITPAFADIQPPIATPSKADMEYVYKAPAEDCSCDPEDPWDPKAWKRSGKRFGDYCLSCGVRSVRLFAPNQVRRMIEKGQLPAGWNSPNLAVLGSVSDRDLTGRDKSRNYHYARINKRAVKDVYIQLEYFQAQAVRTGHLQMRFEFYPEEGQAPVLIPQNVDVDALHPGMRTREARDRAREAAFATIATTTTDLLLSGEGIRPRPKSSNPDEKIPELVEGMAANYFNYVYRFVTMRDKHENQIQAQGNRVVEYRLSIPHSAKLDLLEKAIEIASSDPEITLPYHVLGRSCVTEVYRTTDEALWAHYTDPVRTLLDSPIAGPWAFGIGPTYRQFWNRIPNTLGASLRARGILDEGYFKVWNEGPESQRHLRDL